MLGDWGGCSKFSDYPAPKAGPAHSGRSALRPPGIPVRTPAVATRGGGME